MPTWAYVLVVVVVVLAIVAAVAPMVAERRRSRHLQSTFTSEYDRTVAATGDRREAERELDAREERRAQLNIVALPAARRERYADRWQAVQTDFVDAPQEAVREASTLVQQVMRDRGYPVDDFEQQAADVSVDHADVVGNYRAAHAIWLEGESGQASTEELRQAMRHYRLLFDELLGDPEVQPADSRTEQTVAR